MNVSETALPGVLVLEPRVFADDRGWFKETWNRERYRDLGVPLDFVQDNVSYSTRGVLRGLHYQHPHDQGKLVQVLQGSVFDVAVDIRVGSPTFGRWVGEMLSAENHRQLYIPPGFAHGFCVLGEEAVFSYKCTDFYSGPSEGGVLWNDPDIGVEWPIDDPVLSEKDARCPRLSEIPADRLPSVEDF